jgi:uncharacterized protein YndB with AHSA1/START domain
MADTTPRTDLKGTIQPAPVRRSIEVAAPQAKAFDVFTRKTTAWWPKSHHVGKTPLVEAIIEPKVNGRWFERGADNSECQWGYVIAWEPPQRLVLAWQLNAKFEFDPHLVTEVEIRFTALALDRTRVDLEHRLLERFGEAASTVRHRIGSDGGWTAILRSFGATAALSKG